MSPSLRLALRTLLLSLLLLFFLLQVRESVTKFLSGQTTVAITRETVEAEPPPALSFCPGYRGGNSTEEVRSEMKPLLDHYGDNITKEVIMEWWRSRTYELSDILVQIHSPFSKDGGTGRATSKMLVGDQHLDEVGVEVMENWVDYGRCHTLSFKRDLEDYSYYRIEFDLTMLPRGLLIFMHELQDVVGLNWNNWPVLAPTARFFAKDELSVYVSKIITKNSREKCNNDPNYSYSKCCQEWATRAIANYPEICWYPHAHTVMEGLDLSPCHNYTHFEEVRHSVLMKILIMMTRPQIITTCLPKCLQPSFELDIRHEPVTNFRQTLDGHVTIYLFRKTGVDTQEEYLLYDFNAIVAAVGGSLGLFLGISCLSALLPLVDMLYDKIASYLKKQKQ